MAWKALNFLACLLKRLYIVKMQRLEWNISYIKKKKIASRKSIQCFLKSKNVASGVEAEQSHRPKDVRERI